MPADFRLSPELEEMRRRARAFLAQEMAPDRVAGHVDPTDLTGLDDGFERAHHRAAGAAGFLGLTAPPEYGGGGHPMSWGSAYMYEAAYADAPSIDTAWMLCGGVLREYGSPAQKQRLIPAMVAGELTGCIAYTEPGAGTDLSATATVAEVDGSGWRLSGTKTLITAAHKADFCVTTALTDPGAGARSGMTMFLLDLPAGGVTVTRRPTVNGWTLSDVRFDAAPVGPDSVLGEVNSGWRQLTGAVAQERSGMAHVAWATRIVEGLESWAEGRSLDRGDRESLTQLRIEVDAAWRLSARALAVADSGPPALAESAAAKVWATELLARLARTGSDLVGLAALEWGPLAGPLPGAPLGGRLAYEVLERIHPTISVGSNELQRDIIARVLGLPRGPS